MVVLVVTNWSSLAWVSSVSVSINSWTIWKWCSLSSTLTVANIVMEVIEESIVDGEVSSVGGLGWGSWCVFLRNIDLSKPVNSESMEDLSDVLSVNNSSVEGIHDHITLGVHLGNNIVSELVKSPFHVVVGIIGVSDGIVSGLKDIILLFF